MHWNGDVETGRSPFLYDKASHQNVTGPIHPILAISLEVQVRCSGEFRKEICGADRNRTSVADCFDRSS